MEHDISYVIKCQYWKAICRVILRNIVGRQDLWKIIFDVDPGVCEIVPAYERKYCLFQIKAAFIMINKGVIDDRWITAISDAQTIGPGPEDSV